MSTVFTVFFNNSAELPSYMQCHSAIHQLMCRKSFYRSHGEFYWTAWTVTLFSNISSFEIHVAMMSVLRWYPICKQNHQQLQIIKQYMGSGVFIGLTNQIQFISNCWWFQNSFYGDISTVLSLECGLMFILSHKQSD